MYPKRDNALFVRELWIFLVSLIYKYLTINIKLFDSCLYELHRWNLSMIPFFKIYTVVFLVILFNFWEKNLGKMKRVLVAFKITAEEIIAKK